MKLRNFRLNVGSSTRIMGILNVTPDSFYDGNVYFAKEKAIARAYHMVNCGADIIDIGGQSTRPGAYPVSPDEELERVIPVIESIAEGLQVPISIDTYNHSVADEALKKGASIVNDITALNGDTKMAGIVAKYKAGVILMHIKGTPLTMQKNPQYANIITEILDYFARSINKAIHAGIPPDGIVIDPGIGFGKTDAHNLEILRQLCAFRELDKPILIGVSRKSFIGKITGKEPNQRLFGTAGACAIAIANGASILRVHDIPEMIDVAKVIDAILFNKTD